MQQLRASVLAAALFCICQCRVVLGSSLDANNIRQDSSATHASGLVVSKESSLQVPVSNAAAADWLEKVLWGPSGQKERHHGLMDAHRLGLKRLQLLHMLPEQKSQASDWAAAPTQAPIENITSMVNNAVQEATRDDDSDDDDADTQERDRELDRASAKADKDDDDDDDEEDGDKEDVLSAGLRGVALARERSAEEKRAAAIEKRRALRAKRRAAAEAAAAAGARSFASSARSTEVKRVMTAREKVRAARKEKLRAAARAKSGSAVLQINGMLKQVVEEMELEKSRCQTYMVAAKKEAVDAREISEEDQERLERIGTMLHAARSEQQDIEGQMSDLDEQLKSHKMRCAADIRDLRSELTTLTSDSATTTTLMGASPCKGKAVLLECRHKGAQKSYISTHHKGLHQVMAQLSTSTARHSLQHSLRRSVAHKHKHHRHVVLLQRRSHHRRLRHRSDSHRSERERKEDRCKTAEMDCKVVENAIVLMMADVQDKQHTTKVSLDKTIGECDSVTGDLEREIEHFEQRKTVLSQNMAQALAEKSGMGSQVALRLQEYERVSQGLKDVTKECESSVKAYESQACTLRRSRVDVFTNNGVEIEPQMLQDCEVSPWSPAASCSEQCGGGVQMLIRTVITPAGDKGMLCPALTAQRACNVQPCAKDCKVTEWTPWTECSAICGGGTRSRTRRVEQMAEHGGAICPGENNIADSCNVQPCVPDCVLGSWSPWSACTRACNGGYQQRVRQIAEAARGNALCPSKSQRSEFLKCKNSVCPAPKKAGGTLQCDSASPVDLIVVVDGSSTVGEKNFEKSKAFVASLLKGLSIGAGKGQAAIILAGGPKAWQDFEKCKLAGSSAGALASCNVALTLALSDAESTATGAASGMKAPGGPAYTAGALSLAADQVEQSRPDATPIVLVVAHGKPLSESRTSDEAAKIREKARLMWVVVDGAAEKDSSAGSRIISSQLAASWASEPISDNVFQVDSFQGLEAAAKVSEVLSAVCPTVVGAIPADMKVTAVKK